MRRLVTTTFLLLITISLFSQEILNDILRSNSRGTFQPKKIDIGFTAGTQFTSVSGYGSGLSSYVTPHLSYNVNKRLRIGGGISIIRTNYFNAKSYSGIEQNAFSNGNFTSAMVFVSGQYLLNDRVTIFGSAYKEFPITKDPLPYNPFNPVSRNGSQGVDFNVDYKIGQHVHIQAGFRYSQGVNPIYSNPYYSDPFRSDSYGGGFGFGSPRW